MQKTRNSPDVIAKKRSGGYLRSIGVELDGLVDWSGESGRYSGPGPGPGGTKVLRSQSEFKLSSYPADPIREKLSKLVNVLLIQHFY